MSYSTEIADTPSAQLAKFVTLNRHQLAGQVANLDFWVGEVRHVLDVIDGYATRFERMTKAQQEYVAEHQTMEVKYDPWADRQKLSKPSAPNRVPDGPMREARRQVCDTMYHFLIRAYRDGVITELGVRANAKALGIGVESRKLTTAN